MEFNTSPVTSPLIVVAGGAMYQVNLQTKASAVALADGSDAQARLAQKAGPLFVSDAQGLATLKCQAGQLAVNLATNELMILMPSKAWHKVAQITEAL